MAITHALVSALPDNAADAAAGLVVSSDWNADHAIDSITIAGGTVTASTPLIDATQTWNNGAVAFTGFNLTITDTASDNPSCGLKVTRGLYEWRFADKNDGLGMKYAGSYRVVLNDYNLAFANYGVIKWSSSGTNANGAIATRLSTESASGVLSQYNSTNAQTYRVYGTYTDSSNYVRASLASSSTAVTLAAETAGTGADNVPVNITPAGTEGVVIGNFAQFTEMTAPAAGAANTARLFCEDNGSGKTRLMVQFASGAAQQIAIEP